MLYSPEREHQGRGNLIPRGQDPFNKHQESGPLGEIQEGEHVQGQLLLKLDTCTESKWNQDLLVLVFDFVLSIGCLVSID